MKIGRLFMRNFRGIQDLEIPLDDRLTVFAGVNGSGKSTALDALAILLSWVVARIRHAGGSGRSIRDLDIRNRADHTLIFAQVSHPEPFAWRLVKVRPGHRRGPRVSELGAVSRYAGRIQEQIAESQENCSIPLLAYYPVNRSVLDIPLRIRRAHKFGLLEAWDESLTSAANFRSFFEWFRNREDLENENRKYEGQPIKPDDWEFPDRQLEAVRKALNAFLPEFSQFSVRRNPLRMTVLKRSQEIRVDQLSDGEKCLIALIADLARRLAIANPKAADPLEGEGVILIDEIDLHLHPGWERMVLPRMLRTFPRCQFIVSTHSPLVIGETPAEQVRLLTQDHENRIDCVKPKQSMGLTTNEILDELMRPADAAGTWTRDTEIAKRLDQLFRLIDEESLEEATAEITRLKHELHGDIPELVYAQSLITMMEGDSEG
jgi:predicted ATP-binding protein involved in virulence